MLFTAGLISMRDNESARHLVLSERQQSSPLRAADRQHSPEMEKRKGTFPVYRIGNTC